MGVKKTGLLGGSFDPVHLAHVALAEAALSQLGLDTVQLLPAGQPWQRSALNATNAQRLAMLELAIAHHPKLRINTTEIDRGGPTYTIDTVLALPEDARHYWIVGADQLQNFCTWQRWEDIVERVTLVAAQRPGSTLRAPDALTQRLRALNRPILPLAFQPMRISATDIRQRLADGRPTDGLLDGAVARYIRDNALYHPPAV
ncbi:MAG: nicotinate (nicotinamide) nucleotide adenylyltransferase [Candidimonas sp.]